MKSKMRKIRRYWPLYLMMLPACIYIFINNYVPLPGVSLAFRQYNFQKGISFSQQRRMDHYEKYNWL